MVEPLILPGEEGSRPRWAARTSTAPKCNASSIDASDDPPRPFDPSREMRGLQRASQAR